MKIHISIFSYQRQEMLENLIKELKISQETFDIHYTIFDDGSDFSIEDPNFLQFSHGGKPLFWKMFDRSFKQMEDTEYDIYIFTQSDMDKLDVKRIIYLHNKYGKKEYVYNLHRDDRMFCWNLKAAKSIDEDTYQCWFTDCAFFTNNKTLSKLHFAMYEVNPLRFKANSTISSGVGQQMTQRLNDLNIPMYLPNKSLTTHIGVDSLMHPEERKIHPLISK